jgi:hypothetical protein
MAPSSQSLASAERAGRYSTYIKAYAATLKQIGTYSLIVILLELSGSMQILPLDHT